MGRRRPGKGPQQRRLPLPPVQERYCQSQPADFANDPAAEDQQLMSYNILSWIVPAGHCHCNPTGGPQPLIIIQIFKYLIQLGLHYILLHSITLHYITLHYITLHYTTLHYIALHYITLHDMT